MFFRGDFSFFGSFLASLKTDQVPVLLPVLPQYTERSCLTLGLTCVPPLLRSAYNSGAAPIILGEKKRQQACLPACLPAFDRIIEGWVWTPDHK
jgi:hypothetical protein